jgi:hypothetical protein
MGTNEKVKEALESWLPGWVFKVVDAIGKSGGLAIGWMSSQIRCENIWGFQYGMGIDVYNRETYRAFTVINIYVASGKQSLIFWALREKEAQEGVSP